MCRPVEIVSTLHKLSLEVLNTYEKNKTELWKLSGEIDDLEHELELAKLDCVGLVKMAKEIRKARRRRRECKNENELLEEIFKLVVDEKIDDKFYNLHQKTRAKIVQQENREYCPRVRDDLTISKNYTIDKLKEKLESRNAI